MAKNMMDNGKLAKNTGKAKLLLKTKAIIQANSISTKFMEKVIIAGRIANNIKGNGNIIKCQEKENSNG